MSLMDTSTGAEQARLRRTSPDSQRSSRSATRTIRPNRSQTTSGTTRNHALPKATTPALARTPTAPGDTASQFFLTMLKASLHRRLTLAYRRSTAAARTPESGTRPCLSDKPAEQGSGDRYARFYTFTLDGSANVTIDLSSAEDAYLYLMKGTGRNGEVVESNDDIVSGNTNSQIPATLLEPGEYTIEATTYAAQTSGDFTLVVDIDAIGEPPEPPPAVPYIAISSGANHVCAIATDGSIMCWGEDSEGQVSERPTSGHFTQISSGDNHTCALRDDGAVICWGSFDVP